MGTHPYQGSALPLSYCSIGALFRDFAAFVNRTGCSLVQVLAERSGNMRCLVAHHCTTLFLARSRMKEKEMWTDADSTEFSRLADAEYQRLLSLPPNMERHYNQRYMAFLRDFLAAQLGWEPERVQDFYERRVLEDHPNG